MVLVANLALLLLDAELVPPVPELLTIVINGWLLGREYFELAALRHLSRVSAGQLRRRHGGSVFVGGTMISLLSSVPLVNLLAPLFGVAFMVHLYKRFLAEEHAR
jgi:CysZ protein